MPACCEIVSLVAGAALVANNASKMIGPSAHASQDFREVDRIKIVLPILLRSVEVEENDSGFSLQESLLANVCRPATTARSRTHQVPDSILFEIFVQHARQARLFCTADH